MERGGGAEEAGQKRQKPDSGVELSLRGSQGRELVRLENLFPNRLPGPSEAVVDRLLGDPEFLRNLLLL